MRHTVIIGGSYNPLHIGHLFLAEEVVQWCGCKRVLLIPSHISAHKSDDTSVDPDQRLQMMLGAVENIDWLQVDDCEIRRGGVSFTIETIREIKEKYDFPGRPGLVIGDDLVEGFHKWRNHNEIVEEAEILIAHRLYKEELAAPFPHRYLNNTILPISSSDIRKRINKGRAYRFLLPESVYHYIVSNRLYKEYR